MSTRIIDPHTRGVVIQELTDRKLVARLEALEDKYVRSTRFALIGAGTEGTVTLPPESMVVLDDFGGTVDAVVSTVVAGRPDFNQVLTAADQVVATSFDSAGNYALTGLPAAYPVAVLYRVIQAQVNFDSDSTDIVGVPTVEAGGIATVTSTPGSGNVDGGNPDSSYLPSQQLDGGGP